MKRVIVIICVFTLLLSACAVPAGEYTHGIYELTFSVRRVSGASWPVEWTFAYTCDGEPVESGHRFLYSLELFTFRSIQVEMKEKRSPGNIHTATLRVAVCDGGSGKTELTVSCADGRTAAFEIACAVRLVGKQ